MTSLSAQVPAGRFAEPLEIANVILFLCSKENYYMTGQNIIVDGGFTNV
jgi:3-oxoacyl-[acyl-carrier protein] reductase